MPRMINHKIQWNSFLRFVEHRVHPCKYFCGILLQTFVKIIFLALNLTDQFRRAIRLRPISRLDLKAKQRRKSEWYWLRFLFVIHLVYRRRQLLTNIKEPDFAWAQPIYEEQRQERFWPGILQKSGFCKEIL